MTLGADRLSAALAGRYRIERHLGTPGAPRHLVVLNWFTELKARVEQGNR